MTAELWQLWLPLIAVFLFCGVLAWFAQRWQRSRYESDPVLKLRASLLLGTKERIAVVEVAGQWLVLGVTPGQINTLLTLPAKTGHDEAAESEDPILATRTNWLQRHFKPLP